ncbi:MAG TPA: carbohydrate binding domain-containing protein, partial [Mycobacterium sp.]|nr:carbohydrate binding domain-containing protein [Mycobacterium sp.]
MTHKITVRFGGAADSEVHDYSDRIRLLDASGTPAIHGGMQADNGSPGMGELILDDVDNDIPHRTEPPGLQIAAHNQLIWSEDSPGYEAWLSIGRVDNKSVGRPYTYTAGVNRQWTVQWADANIDLDGLTLTADEERPAETDVDRVLYFLGAFCNGDPRLTTVFGTHLVSSSGTVTMPAKSYEAGTELVEVFDDCASVAGKIYAVVIHEDSGADHTCFLYIDEEDHDTYPCTISISDQLADVDGEAVFEPHWRQGAATLEQGQELITGIVSRYGADTTSTVVVTDSAHADLYDYWVKPYNDDLAATATQATNRATAMVHSRWNEHVSHQPSILIPARLHNLIRAGMSIDIRSAAAMGGQYLGTTQTRRIAAIEWSHAGWTDEPYLWANLQLDRTPRKLPLSQGTRPGPTGPSGSCTDVTSSKAPHFIDGTTTDWGTGGTPHFSTVGGGHGGTNSAGGASGLVDNETLVYLFTGTFTAGKTYTLTYWHSATFDNTMPVSFGAGAYALNDPPTMTDGTTTSVTAISDGVWRLHEIEWTPSANRTGVIVQWGPPADGTPTGLFEVSDGSL